MDSPRAEENDRGPSRSEAKLRAEKRDEKGSGSWVRRGRLTLCVPTPMLVTPRRRKSKGGTGNPAAGMNACRETGTMYYI